LLKGLLAAKRLDAMGEQTSEAFKGHVSSNFARRAGFPPDDGQARLLGRSNSALVSALVLFMPAIVYG
jgi:hypothetical protein